MIIELPTRSPRSLIAVIVATFLRVYRDCPCGRPDTCTAMAELKVLIHAVIFSFAVQASAPTGEMS